MGGPAQPMPQDMMPPPAPAMMPPPPAPAMMPPQGAEQQIVDAEMQGQQAGMQLADNMMAELDGAEDYQSMIDGIRGNSMPLEARYQELASLVGEQDAMATPESVLALTQPTIMMTEQGAMDSGIGELMQGIAGSVDMEGPMDEGVGSLMAAGAGNTPPVNFRNGGPVEVRGYQDGTEVRPGGGSRILTQAEKDVADYEKFFAGGFDQEARAAALEEQNKMSRAQMLFDVAGTALNFAGQTQGGSIAERLANSVTQSQLTDKIGQRAAGMLTAKQAQQAEDSQMRMQARLASLGQAQTDETARQALELASARKGEESIKDIPMSIWKTLDQATKDRILNGKEGTVNGVPLSIYNTLNPSEKRVVLGVQGKEANAVKGVPTAIFNKLSPEEQNRVLLGDPQGVNGVPRDIFNKLDNASKSAILGTTDGPVKGIPAKVFNALSDQQKEKVLLGDPQGVNGIPRDIFNKLDNASKSAVLGTTDGPVKGIPAKVFNALSDQQKEKVLLGDPQGVNGIPMSIYKGLSDKDKKLVLGVTKDVKGIPMSVFETLTADDKNRVLLGDPQGVNGVPRDIFNGLSQVAKNKVLGTGDDPIKGLPRDVFNQLSKQDQNRFILGDPQGVKGIPRDIFDKLPENAQALIVDPAAQSALEVEVNKDKEQRAIEQEAIIYGRNRADELADIDAAVARKIEEEERAEGRTLTADERAQVTWETRNTVTTKNDLDRLAVAQGLRDASQINAEDRAAIVAQNKFEQDQAAKIAAENRAVANRDTIELRLVGSELVKVDTLTGDTTILFGEPTIPDPSMAQVTLKNADGVPVTTVIDVNSPQGKAVLAQVNAANAAAPGSASYQKVPTASTKVQGYLIYNEDNTVKGVYTSYDGKTYIDDDGNAQIITGGSHPVNDTIAYNVAKNEKLVAGARSEIEALDSEIISKMTTFDKDGKPITLNKQQQNEVKDAFAAARKGTGFWSKIYAGIDAVAGGVAPGLFADMFKDTTDARQFVKMVRILGRSALASSPRFAMGDLNAVQELFPNEQALLRSASTETNKLNDIVFYLDEEKRRLLGEIASGKPLDSTMKSQINQKLFEIKRLETILGPVAMLGQASENAAGFDAAVDTMTRARQRAKDAAKKGPP